MIKQVLTKGSMEAVIGAVAGVLINAFLLDNSGIAANAIAAGLGALIGNIVHFVILKKA